MEVENFSSSTITKEEEDHVAPLPGFRFHPTDEELVGFYLRRKVEKRPLSIEIIKQADIYKYDPWDLPKSSNVGDKEWYFFCKRGRKYRNSIRPNRVTGSGFWKATGIDRPIYSSSSVGECIGLKKSLVYYRGSAGKGTKTDWMMHEFRLPATHDKSTKHVDTKTIFQEAEVWTLCRIFKRNISYRKCIPDWRSESAATKRSTVSISPVDANSKTCSIDSPDQKSYNIINFSTPLVTQTYNPAHQHYYFSGHFSSPAISQTPSIASSFSSSICGDIDLFRHSDWEDLRSIVDFADPLS